jgi:hypothetical protein
MHSEPQQQQQHQHQQQQQQQQATVCPVTCHSRLAAVRELNRIVSKIAAPLAACVQATADQAAVYPAKYVLVGCLLLLD